LVRTLLSAISPGTEALIYRGLFPEDLPVDETIPALVGRFSYPLKYGYCTVGEVAAVGPDVDPAWLGRQVFAFHPHESHFTTAVADLLPLPEGISAQEAVFLPNMETAVNLVMDGRPLLGERVAVLGQGVIGLLTAALLARFPLECLATVARYPMRRQASLALGATASLAAEQEDFQARMQALLPGGADLCYELTGSPEALNEAIGLTGFDGRVVIGSWYGRKQAALDLGGRFHRSRIRLISSQVSTLAPELTGRWNKRRRFDLAWQMLRLVRPAGFITHRFPIQAARQAYQLMDESAEQTIQVLLEYP
jgi:threonine dehydrogenase-like Zn-dependent dehydrogenase